MGLWRTLKVPLRADIYSRFASSVHDTKTAKLRSYIRNLIYSSLEQWEPSCHDLRDSVSAALTEQIIANCCTSHACGSRQRSAIASQGKILASYFSRNPGKLDTVLSNSAAHYLEMHDNMVNDGLSMFESLRQHHNTIRQQPWQDVTSNTDALRAYAEAACNMGKRRWLQDSNSWLLSFASRHFTPSQSCPLRILDVGSCYNPLIKSSEYDPAVHKVTAIDLHPAHESVYTCDFIGTAVEDINFLRIKNTSVQALPRHFFDVVCMSVVLSYVPYPEQRAAMIAKAREVTRCSEKPGLLLLVEKPSIFSPRKLFDCGDNEMIESAKRVKERIADLWISTICAAGYECILSEQNAKRHLMAFRTSTRSNTPPDALFVATYDDERDRIRAAIYRIRESQLPVCIAGAGIGGSALAALLQQRNIPYILLEKDVTFACRKQGYALTLQQALSPVRRLLQTSFLPGAVSSYTHVSFDARGRVLGVYGPPLQESKIASKQNVHISRQQLRQLLMDKIDNRNVKWGSCIESYIDRIEAVTVRCAGGANFEASCLIAADGIHSRIRRVKHPHHTLRYLNLLVILGIAENDFKVASQLSYRKAQWVDGTTRVFTMPYDTTHTMWQLSFPCEEALASSLSRDSHALHQLALEKTLGWHTPLVRLLHKTDLSRISGHGVYDRDIPAVDDMRGDVSSLVTFVGDAWHPMSPFKGQGANQAIIDSDALTSHLQKYYTGRCKSLAEMLAIYEAKMMQGAKNKVLRSRSAAEFLHSSLALTPGNITRAAAAEILGSA